MIIMASMKAYDSHGKVIVRAQAIRVFHESWVLKSWVLIVRESVGIRAGTHVHSFWTSDILFAAFTGLTQAFADSARLDIGFGGLTDLPERASPEAIANPVCQRCGDRGAGRSGMCHSCAIAMNGRADD